MDIQNTIIFIIEIIGTIAFAVSGAMVAIKSNMDIFGVSVLGTVTACGGGMIRDIVIGNVPNSLLAPSYVLISIVTSLLIFIIMYFKKSLTKEKNAIMYDKVLMAMDSIGLGIFTVVGARTGVIHGHGDNILLLVFLGAITGVGGGLLRDIMADVPPYILNQDIYACASIVGGIIFALIYSTIGQIPAMIISTIIIIIIRYVAKYYNWNLPRVNIDL